MHLKIDYLPWIVSMLKIYFKLIKQDSIQLNLENIYDAHVKFGKIFEKIYPKLETVKLSEIAIQQSPLRIGYLSPDFFTHSVSYFIEPLLMHHDSSNFVTIW